MTTHSLAYQNVVKPMKLKVGFFNYRDIKKRIGFEIKLLIIEHIKSYCLSEHVSFTDYASTHNLQNELIILCRFYLNEMKTGKINCTHEFYLKYYHILLSGKAITHEPFDVIMLDEAGDLNPVTLEIFKLLPSGKKVMVGDPQQNIYSFNQTINGFEAMKDYGVHLSLSQSFRVSSNIAQDIEYFCKQFLDPTMDFKGVNYSQSELDSIVTKAYISRTNGALISHMMKLNNSNIPYNLTRPAKSIFAMPLALISLNSKGVCYDPQFKYIEQDYKDYADSPSLLKSSSFYGYIAKLHADDPNVKTAVKLIADHGAYDVVKAFEVAKSHEGISTPLTLCTAHSSKGLEFDSVHVADDMTNVLSKILDSKKVKERGLNAMDNTEREEFRLAYVLISRCKKELTNAKFLQFTVGNHESEDEINRIFNDTLDNFYKEDY